MSNRFLPATLRHLSDRDIKRMISTLTTARNVLSIIFIEHLRVPMVRENPSLWGQVERALEALQTETLRRNPRFVTRIPLVDPQLLLAALLDLQKN